MNWVKKNKVLAVVIVLFIVSGLSIGLIILSNDNPEYWPTVSWLESTPEEQGMDGTILDQAETLVFDELFGINNMLIIRNGYIVKEIYFDDLYTDYSQNVFSVTKSFMSTLIGIAIDRGDISNLQLQILDIFSERNFINNDDDKRAINIENLLKMESGLPWSEVEPFSESNLNNNYIQMAISPDWVQYVLDLPMVGPPGSQWIYNTGGSHLLSVLLSHYTNQTAESYAQEHLFDPLGISAMDFYWEIDPQGNSHGGSSLHMMARDMAKLGYLYLNKGNWDGVQLISENYVDMATSTLWTVNPEQGIGYGYQWWTDINDEYFFAAGYRGQYIIVHPEYDLVVVFQSNAPSYPPLTLFEEYIMPSIIQ